MRRRGFNGWLASGWAAAMLAGWPREALAQASPGEVDPSGQRGPESGRTAAEAALAPEVAAFVAEVSARHGFDPVALSALLAAVRPQPRVLAAMQAQSQPRPWYDYRAAFVNRSRVAGGVRFWGEHQAPLERAHAAYGVPPELVVATIAAETLFGRQMGTHPVLDTLAALAFGFPRRAEFFRGELEQFLLLVRDLDMDPARPVGSFAGAMGIPQFMPSSYRRLAVDFDGDGRIDLWRSPADAIGSVANYYRAHGWVTDGPVAVAVEAAADVAQAQAARGIRPHTAVGDLRELGIAVPADIDPGLPAMVFPLAFREGTRYWAGFDNFFVITRYNRAIHYAMAVHELAVDIRAARGAGDGVAAAPAETAKGMPRANGASRRERASRRPPRPASR